MSEPNGDVRALIEQIARSLVEAPDQVVTDVYEDGDETVVELEVAPTDIGRVIGRQGRVVRAMRTVLGAVGVKQDKFYALEIVE